MTEQDERTRRKQIQVEKGLSELEAVEYMAEEINSRNHEVSDDQFFMY